MKIYAEISSVLAERIENGYVIPIPNGVEVEKVGARGYLFEVDDQEQNTMIDILESHGINWQDEMMEEEVRKRVKKAKMEIKKQKKLIKSLWLFDQLG